MHLGSIDCDEDLFIEHLSQIENDPNARIICNGDLLQMDLKKSKGSVYDQKYKPSHQKRLMRDLLMPIKDKILGMIDGNHDSLRTDEDATPIWDIAEWLGVPYLGGQGMFKIPVGWRPNGKPYVYTVYCTHGWSNSRAMGGKANNLQRLSDIVLADVYCISHTHTPMTFPDTYYIPDLRNNNMILRTRHYVNSGSYQKRGVYPTTKGMRPVALVNPQITLHGTKREISVEIAG